MEVHRFPNLNLPMLFITFDELNHPSFQTYLTIYLFICLFTRFSVALPPPRPCDVKSIRRCLSWPPGNNAHLVKKTLTVFLRHEYIHILFAYDCVVVVAVVVGRYLFVNILFFLYYFLNFPFLLVIVFLLLLLFFSMLLCWLTGCVFTLKLVSSRHITILAMLLSFDFYTPLMHRSPSHFKLAAPRDQSWLYSSPHMSYPYSSTFSCIFTNDFALHSYREKLTLYKGTRIRELCTLLIAKTDLFILH